MDFDAFLREACPPLDLQWRKYRRRGARRSVCARIDGLGLDGYEAYLGYLRSHPYEASGLADRMRVTVSRFFRDRKCWQELASCHLPAYLGSRAPEVYFQSWSVGCCGGEEPFTLVILWREYLTRSFPGIRLVVKASDIDPPSLRRAESGRFCTSSLREMDSQLRDRWFRRNGDSWKLDPGIVKAVEFAETGLMDGPPTSDQDLVLCRYLVFTYYRGARRLEAARRLHESLRRGGVLFIGRKEGLGPEEQRLFEPLDPRCGIYRRRELS